MIGAFCSPVGNIHNAIAVNMSGIPRMLKQNR